MPVKEVSSSNTSFATSTINESSNYQAKNDAPVSPRYPDASMIIESVDQLASPIRTDLSSLFSPGGSVAPVPHNHPIDQQKVTLAVRGASVLVPLNASNLANVLTNPTLNLNQAERDQVIQDLARQGGLEFYANDVPRGNGGKNDYTSLQADEAFIGNAVQQAYADGAIKTSDLVHIADVSQVPNGGGGQRFLDILMQGGEAASQKGSAAESLADALWARNGNNGVDRAAAAMYYSSNALTMENDLTTPAMRQQAFTALVNFNQTGPYSGLPNNQLVTGWKNQAIAAEANLFAANSQEIRKGFTSDDTPNIQVLAHFFSHTVFNPSAQNIQLDDCSTLQSSMKTTVSNVSSSLIGAAQQADPNSNQQTNAIEELGRLSGALSSGVALALTKYDTQIQANAASQQQFSDLVGSIIAAIPVLGKVPGAGQLGTSIVSRVIGSGTAPRPSPMLAIDLADQYANIVQHLQSQPRQPQNLLGNYQSAFGFTLNTLGLGLNFNLGGHAG